MTDPAIALAVALGLIITALWALAIGYLIDVPEPEFPRAQPLAFRRRERRDRASRGMPGGRYRRGLPALTWQWPGWLLNAAWRLQATPYVPRRAACGACSAGNHDECFGGDCSCCGPRRGAGRLQLGLAIAEAEAEILKARTLLLIGL